MSAAHLSTSTLSTYRVGQFVVKTFSVQESDSSKAQPLFFYVLYVVRWQPPARKQSAAFREGSSLLFRKYATFECHLVKRREPPYSNTERSSHRSLPLEKIQRPGFCLKKTC